MTGSSGIVTGSGAAGNTSCRGGTKTASGAGSGTISGGGAGGFAVFTRRGGGSDGAAGRCGSDGFAAGLRPRAATGASAKDALDGTLIFRWRASRSTNCRATTSSIVLDALFTSMP
jgi:hypothetical protein